MAASTGCAWMAVQETHTKHIILLKEHTKQPVGEHTKQPTGGHCAQRVWDGPMKRGEKLHDDFPRWQVIVTHSWELDNLEGYVMSCVHQTSGDFRGQGLEDIQIVVQKQLFFMPPKVDSLHKSPAAECGAGHVESFHGQNMQ
eukprot:1148607-Pelagomonas_calceolata.AAC.21